jgi:hypothetical protein
MTDKTKLSEIFEDSGFLDYREGEIPSIEMVNYYRHNRMRHKTRATEIESHLSFELGVNDHFKVSLHKILRIIEGYPSITATTIERGRYIYTPQKWQDVRDYIKEGIDRGFIKIDERMGLHLTDSGNAYFLSEFGEIE